MRASWRMALIVWAAASLAGRLAEAIEKTSPNCMAADCHGALAKQKFVHGPVGAGQCSVCHKVTDRAKHKFTMAEEGNELCLFCHLRQDTKKYVHEPVKTECSACHDSHGSSAKFLLVKKDTHTLCMSCHKLVEKKFVHGPVAAGACIACHRPHQSDHPALAYRSGARQCFTCHSDLEKKMKRGVHVHQPAREDCRKCHTAHSSDHPMQLLKSGNEMCLDCHKDVSKQLTKANVTHGALKILEGCLNCHEPHAAQLPFALRHKPIELCLTCHDKELTTPEGKKLQNIKHVLETSKFKHGPIREGDCQQCHQAHGSTNHRLLTKYFPQEFYKGFDLNSYTLCFACHEKSLVLHKRTTTLTRFRNGDVNLHFLHVNRNVKGRTCRACHRVHASNLPAHVRKAVPFGKRRWMLPLDVKLTKTGGRCSGCHRPMGYDRVNPVNNDVQTQAQ